MEDKGLSIQFKFTGDQLELSGLEDKPSMINFIDNFQSKMRAKNESYFLEKNSKLYLVKHQNNYFIVIVDRRTSDNSVTYKRCFNRFGDFISSVTDVKLSNGN